VFQQIEKGSATSSKQGGLLGLGSPILPELPRHAGDRNRTSPFAFTGNKFEFRAVGSSQSISFPNAVLNVIVADALDTMATKLEKRLKGGRTSRKAFEEAVGKVIQEVMKEAKPIIFNGDNYSEAWHKEAEKRGLLNLRTTLDALAKLLDKKNVSLFERFKVLSERELHSRFEIWVEQYFKTINIEGEMTETMARTMILPAAVQYLRELTEVIDNAEDAGVDVSGVVETAKEVSASLTELRKAINNLIKQNKELGGSEVLEKARHMQNNVIPAMAAVRHATDDLERMIPEHLWPVPTYREILFYK
ncbi:MAG TPA: glutamine synthetase type III, partial [Rhodothermales bacterium]